jgi:hypothetical protein
MMLASFPVRRAASVRPTYGPEGRVAGLYDYLPKARWQQRPRYGRKPRASFIPADRSIQQRPTEVEDRQTFGHWKADLLIFRRERSKVTLTAMIERQTRFTSLLSNPDRQSNALVGRIGQAWQRLPKGSCRTVTFDRGIEFAVYGLLAKQVCTEVYFCDPHSPWQKGAIENANGRIRRFLPGYRNMIANHQNISQLLGFPRPTPAIVGRVQVGLGHSMPCRLHEPRQHAACAACLRSFFRYKPCERLWGVEVHLHGLWCASPALGRDSAWDGASVRPERRREIVG